MLSNICANGCNGLLGLLLVDIIGRHVNQLSAEMSDESRPSVGPYVIQVGRTLVGTIG